MPKSDLEFTKKPLVIAKVLANFWNGKYKTIFGLKREKYATNKYFMLQQLDNSVDKEVIMKMLKNLDILDNLKTGRPKAQYKNVDASP